LVKQIGDAVNVAISVDTNPLGLEMPEGLEVLLDQDEELHQKFIAYTTGKKRSIIFAINKIKRFG
jgi:uncharacterized protein YdeI (YjbR/CyaY-like superfamily)